MPNDRSRCLSCRALHARCTIDPGRDVCSRCRSLGRPQCTFESMRFKLCKTTTIAAQRTDFLYSPSQPWVPTNIRLVFVTEAGDGLENIVKPMGNDTSSSADKEICTSDQLSESRNQNSTAQFIPTDSVDATLDSNWAEPLHTAIELLNRRHDESPAKHDPPEQNISLTPISSSSPTLSMTTTLATTETPPICSESKHFNSMESDPHTNASLSTNISTSPKQSLTHREAVLIHYFISIISPWPNQLDVLQDIPRFAQEAPLRATKSPMLLYSILAASSRHQTLQNSDWQEASGYLGKCLKLVIQALSHPENSHSDDLLLTIVCLRLYELFSHETFSVLHLDGLACLSSAIPTFLKSGGLAEAAAWIALRHDLFIAMMSKQPPKFPLDDFDNSSVFQRRTDAGAPAYKIILIWARMLRHLYSTDPDTLSTAWLGLEHAVRSWYNERGFQPLFQQDANVDHDQPFPIISMSSAPQVIALEFYHTCQVYLNLYKSLDLQQAGADAVQEDRLQAAIDSICSIIGLARSNAWVDDANFPACHILITCPRAIGERDSNTNKADIALQIRYSVIMLFGF
ncbi:hypothetical protein E4T44_05105 [Aureobasidium sp. EXF-8845]|nr:hypothetical protein E4T44_05105 [Aureobasidium sp. EXF-8845]KAI4856848.1 hypothetical protein E4T45_01671 [Aureobasidium sp. EXF-8846]